MKAESIERQFILLREYMEMYIELLCHTKECDASYKYWWENQYPQTKLLNPAFAERSYGKKLKPIHLRTCNVSSIKQYPDFKEFCKNYGNTDYTSWKYEYLQSPKIVMNDSGRYLELYNYTGGGHSEDYIFRRKYREINGMKFSIGKWEINPLFNNLK